MTSKRRCPVFHTQVTRKVSIHPILKRIRTAIGQEQGMFANADPLEELNRWERSNLDGFPNVTLTLCRGDGSSRDEPIIEGSDMSECLKKFHDKYPGIHLEFHLLSDDEMSAID